MVVTKAFDRDNLLVSVIETLLTEENDFIFVDNCIAICNTRTIFYVPVVMRFNLFLVLMSKVMILSFLV